MITDEITMIKGEAHYVWPHSYKDGNSTKCYQCRYFVEDVKQRFPHCVTGECHSNAHQTERGYTHRLHGWDKTEAEFGCKWWFPIEKQPGEQEKLYEDAG